MSNTIEILLNCFFILICLIIIFLSIKDGLAKRVNASIVFIASMFLCWNVALILFFAAKSFEWSYRLYDLDLPFVALVILATYNFVLQFYRLEIYIQKAPFLSLLLVPLFSLVLFFFLPSETLYRSHLEIISTSPVHVVEAVPGIWFWLHSVYCYLLTLIIIIVVITQHKKLPKQVRSPSYFLAGGIVASVFANIIVLLKLGIRSFDITLVGVMVCIIFMYIATRTNHGMDFFIRSRINIFNNLKEGIFILDDFRMVINKNKAFMDVFEFVGIDQKEDSYEKIEALLKDGAYRIEPSPDMEGGTDYYFERASEKKVFRIFEKSIFDNRQNLLGTFIVCNDFTENRNLISRLDEFAGVDALTGLANRRSLEKYILEFDKADQYPLAVIVGDLNNLKKTNDILGHQQGDVMIRAIAETLHFCCPANACIARTGGDEFVIVLPKTSATKANKLVNDIKQTCSRMDTLPFSLSIALGFDVKEHVSQNIKDTISSADNNMYTDKKAGKNSLSSDKVAHVK